MTKTAIAEERAQKVSATELSPERAVAVPVARKEIKPLTSLRFFAALAILLYHGGERFTCLQGLHNRYIPEQAVTFFFVLSGFILTYNYVDIKDFKATVSFYLARFSRIWPAHVASLLLLVFTLPEVFKVKSADWPLFLRNLFLLQSWGLPSRQSYFSYNSTAWSISTEMFFYLCFPFLLWGMKKRWYFPIAVTAALLGLLIAFSNFVHLPEYDLTQLSYQGLLFISPLSSVFSFGVGMSAAVIWRDRLSHINLNKTTATLLELSIIAWVCIVNQISSPLRYASKFWAGDGGAFWIQNTGAAVLGCAMLIAIFAWDRGWISRLLRTPSLVLLGELSFGIYLLHSVLITFLGVNFPQEQSLNACFVFLVTLFVSTHLLFEVVEKPMRRFMIKHGLAFIGLVESQIKNTATEDMDNLQQHPVSISATTGNVATTGNGATAQSGTLGGKCSGKSASIGIGSSGSRAENQKAGTGLAGKAKVPLARRRGLLILEALAFVVFIYFSLPTIHRLTDSEASTMAAAASIRDVALSPYLICRGATANVSGKEVSLSLIWEALRPESVNFSVTAIAVDGAGKPIGSTSYTQDGRQQWVKRGACWVDRATISVSAQDVPASINLTVLRNKHAVLHSTASSGNLSFSVPVQSP